jgi:hypothetical protein
MGCCSPVSSWGGCGAMPRAIGGAEAGRTLCFPDSLPPDLLVRSPSADPPWMGRDEALGLTAPTFRGLTLPRRRGTCQACIRRRIRCLPVRDRPPRLRATCGTARRDESAPTTPVEAAIATVVLRQHATRAPTTLRRPDRLADQFGSGELVRADSNRAGLTDQPDYSAVSVRQDARVAWNAAARGDAPDGSNRRPVQAGATVTRASHSCCSHEGGSLG